jgi:hypothetical protein
MRTLILVIAVSVVLLGMLGTTRITRAADNPTNPGGGDLTTCKSCQKAPNCPSPVVGGKSLCPMLCKATGGAGHTMCTERINLLQGYFYCEVYFPCGATPGGGSIYIP